jgi:hypothetical protein
LDKVGRKQKQVPAWREAGLYPHFDRTLFIFPVLLNKRLIPFPSLCGGEEVAIVPVEYIQ